MPPTLPPATESGLRIVKVRSNVVLLFPFSLAPEHFLDLLAEVRGRTHDADARRFERFHLLRRRALAPGDDRPRVAHAAPRRGGLAGDERDDGLLEVAGDPARGLFLRHAADLADQHDGLGTRVVLERLQAVDEVRAVDRVAA